QAKEQADREDERRNSAYRDGLKEVREWVEQRQSGWVDKTLEKLTALGSMNVASREPLKERRLAAIALGGLDCGPGREVFKGEVTCLDFSPDNQCLAVALRDLEGNGTGVRLLDMTADRILTELPVPHLVKQGTPVPDGIRSLAFLGVNRWRWLAAGTESGKV